MPTFFVWGCFCSREFWRRSQVKRRRWACRVTREGHRHLCCTVTVNNDISSNDIVTRSKKANVIMNTQFENNNKLLNATAFVVRYGSNLNRSYFVNNVVLVTKSCKVHWSYSKMTIKTSQNFSYAIATTTQYMLAGVETTLSRLRRRLWVDSVANQFYEDVWYQWHVINSPETPNLPNFRISDTFSFYNIWLDYDRPLYVRESAKATAKKVGIFAFHF